MQESGIGRCRRTRPRKRLYVRIQSYVPSQLFVLWPVTFVRLLITTIVNGFLALNRQSPTLVIIEENPLLPEFLFEDFIFRH